jgi:hypothetical protein
MFDAIFVPPVLAAAPTAAQCSANAAALVIPKDDAGQALFRFANFCGSEPKRWNTVAKQRIFCRKGQVRRLFLRRFGFWVRGQEALNW